MDLLEVRIFTLENMSNMLTHHGRRRPFKVLDLRLDR
jgi:hypothetical protein